MLRRVELLTCLLMAAVQVRLSCVPDGPCLHSLVQFLYLDDVQQQAELTPQLHVVALACNLQRLVDLCEARFAQQLELQLLSWQGEQRLGRRQLATPAQLDLHAELPKLFCGRDSAQTSTTKHAEFAVFVCAGLSKERRHAVLDSFIGWCLHCEQLQRQKLRQLCVHALARHVALAQSR